MPQGRLKVEVKAAESAIPIVGAAISITGENGEVYELLTDISGNTEYVTLEAPDAARSLDEYNTLVTYSSCRVTVRKAKYYEYIINGVQIFDAEDAILPLELEPLPLNDAENGSQGDTDVSEAAVAAQKTFTVPPLNVNDPTQNIDVPPEGSRILTSVVIPEYITVHLGRPDASATNLTVPFLYYIKNVCCSEIYPTWPENAIRANVYCQVSLALNRIYTEWYRSRGYAFDITNSTSYDQYFVQNRNIFDNISKIVDSIFDNYIRKNNYSEPFYAEYCNGTTATCPGLKQWGTVDLAELGYSPLEILRYYYGTGVNLYIARAVSGTPQSYPGTALRRGSTGDDVTAIQNQLIRIRQNYPAIPNPGTADGVFGASTESAVRSFQSIFNLTADGVVGRATWYKLSYIFVAVKKLAELGSEGVFTPSVPASPPTTVLRQGATGQTVILAQFLLNLAEYFYQEIEPVTVDGIFGAGTRNTVISFQRLRSLSADGVIGPLTWQTLFETYYGVFNSITPSSLPYPGTALRYGSYGSSVTVMQRYLNVIAGSFPSVTTIAVDGVFGLGTQLAVRGFQQTFGLTVDGVIGPATWNRIVLTYDSLV